MKKLFLLRHAKSSWAVAGLDDFDRPLNARGEKAARAIGREMRRLDLAFDLVISSPAARAEATLAGVEEGYGRGLDAVFDGRIYLASVSQLREIVQAAADMHARLLLIGHNPGFEQLALTLAQDDSSGAYVAMAEKYPTGTLAEIHFPVERWRDVAAGEGRLVRFIRPADIDLD